MQLAQMYNYCWYVRVYSVLHVSYIVNLYSVFLRWDLHVKAQPQEEEG